MDIQFPLSNDQLVTLLKAFSNWYEKDEREKKYAIDFRQKDIELRKTLLNQEYLSKVSDDELAQKIFEYSRTLEGPAHIRLGMPRITGELKNLKRNLTYLVDSPDDPFRKAQEFLEGKYKIPIFAKAFWTPLFQAKYPDVMPNWNNKTENFFEKVGIKLKTSKLKIEEKYRLISEAFLYFQKLDPKQDFHNLNHLMHYGTVIDEGVALIEKFLNPKSGGDDIPKDYLVQKITRWRAEHLSDKRISVRQEAENTARKLLSEMGGKFDESALRKFFELMNKDFWKGKVKSARFAMAYTGHNVNRLVDQLDIVNEWIDLFWKVSDENLKELLDTFYSKNPIQNAGTAFPSLILYLRDPAKFNLCFKRMVTGLKNITDFSEQRYSGNFYLKYNDKVNELKKEYVLIPEELDILLCIAEAEIPGTDKHPDALFNEKTFKLLQDLHESPYRDFYQNKRSEFKKELEEPFQQLFRDVSDKLPSAIAQILETEKGLFSRIVKNDFGRGGAWDHYWGAFYPKGGKRIEDAQLFIWINREIFQFGFFIGTYGVEQRKRFLLNCRNNLSTLENILSEPLSDPKFNYGNWDKELDDGKIPEHIKELSLQEWLSNPEDRGINVAIYLTKNKLQQLSYDQLVDEIVSTFNSLFPLMILTISDNPLPSVMEFLELDQEEAEIQPLYSLEQCAEATGFEGATLERWVRAIERKRQAVFYGPPGTGKTFIAEHMAKHLVGGGDGFYEIVQFHPAYAYEDFIQGIRPKAREDGGLDYPIVPGRFLKFCKKADKCNDCCILIIDEINRANLARVFGELMYLLEYRDQEVPLASGGYLRIPDNVKIIGTMNTADRSIALVDHALRRRFAFLALYPNYEVLSRYHQNNDFNVEPLINVLKRLNNQIADRHYEVGISFFLREDLMDQIEDIWNMEIEPYLEEYFFDQPDKTDSFRWNKIGKDVLI